MPNKEKPRLVQLNLSAPNYLTPNINTDIDDEFIEGTPKKKSSLLIIVTIGLASFFASSGIALFASFGSIIISSLTSLVTAFTGMNGIIISFLLMAILFFISAVLYVKYRMGTTLSEKVNQALFGKYYAYDNIDLSQVSLPQLALEMRKRGCVTLPVKGNGTTIICNEKIELERIQNDLNKMNVIRKLTAIIVSVIIIAVIILAQILGILLFIDPFLWIVYLAVVGIVMFILLNAGVIKLYMVAIVLFVYFIIAYIFGLIDISLSWIIVCIMAIAIVFIATLYYLKANFKKSGSWIYDFL